MAFDIREYASQVLAGAFLARAVYGGEYIQPEYDLGPDDDAEKADDYRGYLASVGSWSVWDDTDITHVINLGADAKFTGGGLYNARVELTNTFDAQALVAVENCSRLVLAFRGTDGKDPALTGQAFTGEGLASHYEAFAPLIDALYDYMVNHPEITEIVVSGHSLGGALVDVFTLTDAERFRALRPDGLTLVSLGSRSRTARTARIFPMIFRISRRVSASFRSLRSRIISSLAATLFSTCRTSRTTMWSISIRSPTRCRSVGLGPNTTAP
jgi:pimeloyl-ACP methyl ester carboxylesterase